MGAREVARCQATDGGGYEAFLLRRTAFIASLHPGRTLMLKRAEGRCLCFTRVSSGEEVASFPGVLAFAATLGHWHLTRIEAGAAGLPLLVGAG